MTVTIRFGCDTCKELKSEDDMAMITGPKAQCYECYDAEQERKEMDYAEEKPEWAWEDRRNAFLREY